MKNSKIGVDSSFEVLNAEGGIMSGMLPMVIGGVVGGGVLFGASRLFRLNVGFTILLTLVGIGGGALGSKMIFTKK